MSAMGGQETFARWTFVAAQVSGRPTTTMRARRPNCPPHSGGKRSRKSQKLTNNPIPSVAALDFGMTSGVSHREHRNRLPRFHCVRPNGTRFAQFGHFGPNVIAPSRQLKRCHTTAGREGLQRVGPRHRHPRERRTSAPWPKSSLAELPLGVVSGHPDQLCHRLSFREFGLLTDTGCRLHLKGLCVHSSRSDERILDYLRHLTRTLPDTSSPGHLRWAATFP